MSGMRWNLRVVLVLLMRYICSVGLFMYIFCNFNFYSYSLAPYFQLNLDILDKSCIGLVNQLLNADVDILNLKILICIFWSLLKRYTEIIKQNTMVCGFSILPPPPNNFSREQTLDAWSKCCCSRLWWFDLLINEHLHSFTCRRKLTNGYLY